MVIGKLPDNEDVGISVGINVGIKLSGSWIFKVKT